MHAANVPSSAASADLAMVSGGGTSIGTTLARCAVRTLCGYARKYTCAARVPYEPADLQWSVIQRASNLLDVVRELCERVLGQVGAHLQLPRASLDCCRRKEIAHCGRSRFGRKQVAAQCARSSGSALVDEEQVAIAKECCKLVREDWSGAHHILPRTENVRYAGLANRLSG
jgi:hypothetical protein